MATKFAALVSALTVALALGITANAATTTKPYTATWVSGDTVLANPLPVPAGSATLTLRITNKANPQTLGSANIRPPDGYTLTGVLPLSLPATAALDTTTNTVKLRNLNLAPLVGIVDVTVDVTTACSADGVARPWELIVKQANNFSGPPGNDFVIQPADAYPSTVRAIGSACQLRFANQPNTTQVSPAVIKDGVGSTGNPIKVEIFDPVTNLVVNSNANVTLTPVYNPAGGTLAGGTVSASAGVATFSSLSLNEPGPYRLKASSPAASNEPISPTPSAVFMIVETLQTCTDTTCTFDPLTDAGSSYSTQPQGGTVGAHLAASLNLDRLLISCDFAPFNYPDNRQPNAIWYVYSGTGAKNNTIIIDKAIVQVTPENGASSYQVCFTSPKGFKARNGIDAPDSSTITLNTPLPPGMLLPSDYFGQTWYIGLLPDCGKKAVAPCVTGRSGSGAGNRTIKFITPDGDPGYK